MKAYHEVCADIIMMLEELEESLDEITKEAENSEFQPKFAEMDGSWLERYFDFKLEK